MQTPAYKTSASRGVPVYVPAFIYSRKVG